MNMWEPHDPPAAVPNQPPAYAMYAGAPAAPPHRRPLGRLFWVRLVGGIVIALAALSIYFGMAPAQQASAADRASLVLSLNKQNEADADSAPKQAVVNGWVARDLLTIIASESDRTDERPAALLMLGVVGIAFFGATSPVSRSRS